MLQENVPVEHGRNEGDRDYELDRSNNVGASIDSRHNRHIEGNIGDVAWPMWRWRSPNDTPVRPSQASAALAGILASYMDPACCCTAHHMMHRL